MAHDVFISYSSKNKTTADAICHILEQNKIKCWIAPRDIAGGQKYGDVIEKSIKSCQVFILIFSEYSKISPWVESELNLAFSDRKIIIPFKIDNSELEGEMRLILNNKHWIEAFPEPEKEFGTLLRSFEKLNLNKGEENEKSYFNDLKENYRNRINFGKKNTEISSYILNEAKKKFLEGIEYYNSGEYGHNKAIASFGYALTLNPNFADAYYEMGKCYMKLGYTSSQKACYKEAAKLGHKAAYEWLNNN